MEYVKAKSILAVAKSNEWFGSDYNMNLYRGCSHSCIYCDSRSERYYINEFDKVKVKEDAINILRTELKKKKSGVVSTGCMSDPYNPLEKSLKLTRSALEVLDECRFGVGVATKSNLVVRDIDVFERIKKHSPVDIKITITTIDDKVCKKIEPNVCVTSERLEAIKQLADRDIYTGVLYMPVLPYITDSIENMVEILRSAKACGASFVYPDFCVTLRGRQRYHYYNKLDELYPGIKNKYIKRYGDTYRCYPDNVEELKKTFVMECDRLGLLYKLSDIVKLQKDKYGVEQLKLF